MQKQCVVVVGASNKTHRYSYRALKLLKHYGHEVIPVHPMLKDIDGTEVVADLAQIQQSVDTLTLYVGAEHSRPLMDKILALKPRRVIFNPGTACSDLEDKLRSAGITSTHDCTLIMLESDCFDL